MVNTHQITKNYFKRSNHMCATKCVYALRWLGIDCCSDLYWTSPHVRDDKWIHTTPCDWISEGMVVILQCIRNGLLDTMSAPFLSVCLCLCLTELCLCLLYILCLPVCAWMQGMWCWQLWVWWWFGCCVPMIYIRNNCTTETLRGPDCIIVPLNHELAATIA